MPPMTIKTTARTPAMKKTAVRTFRTISWTVPAESVSVVPAGVPSLMRLRMGFAEAVLVSGEKEGSARVRPMERMMADRALMLSFLIVVI